MGCGKALTNEKYWWVIGLHDGGVSLREIARRTDRSRSASRRAIKAERGPQSDDRGERPKAGRRPVLSDREVRQVVRAAATGDYFAAELKTKFSVTASVRTIPRLLKNVDHLVYTKMDRTLPLTAAHKSARMAWAEEPILNPDYVFQQDNASIYASRETKHLLQEMQVNTMVWPARLPDYNPIENVWSAMASRLYAHGRQYDNVDQLEAAIFTAWDSVEQEYLLKLLKSMPRRCFAVIKGKGALTQY
ncbi:hypothetical protein PC123_g22634 [Phytophthora cactorum]|nr:hypothetical protein PC123_g22634 [Phytophthora cactorum]